MNSKIPDDSIFSNLGTKIKVAFFGVGAVISSTGQILYGLRKLAEYWGMNNNEAQSLMWIGSITTLYVRVKTRFPALLKQFSKKADSQKPLTLKQKIALGTVGASGLVSGLANGAQSYLGGIAVLRLVSINDQNGDYFMGAYSAFASLGSYYAFFVQNSIDNARALTDIQSLGNKSQLAKNSFKTTIVTTLGASALGIFSYFAFNGFLEVLPDDSKNKVSNATRLSFSLLALASTAVTTLLSRVAETYKYFSSEPALDFRDLTVAKKAALAPSLLCGSLDIFVFIATLYISCINIAESENIDIDPYALQSLSALAALSGGFMHWVFSVRKILKADLVTIRQEMLDEAQKIPEVMPSEKTKKEDRGCAQLLMTLNGIFGLESKQKKQPKLSTPLISHELSQEFRNDDFRVNVQHDPALTRT
jgi:hypothetical protein